jgi:hypothetical protein
MSRTRITQAALSNVPQSELAQGRGFLAKQRLALHSDLEETKQSHNTIKWELSYLLCAGFKGQCGEHLNEFSSLPGTSRTTGRNASSSMFWNSQLAYASASLVPTQLAACICDSQVSDNQKLGVLLQRPPKP